MIRGANLWCSPPQKKRREQERRARGLGGILHKEAAERPKPANEKKEEQKIETSKDIVGEGPAPKKGALARRWEARPPPSAR